MVRSLRVRWLLNIAVAAMVALGALLLTLGQGGFVLPLVAVAAAAGSVWLTDVTGWFRLSRVAVNAGVIAVGAMIAARSFWLAGIFDASDLAGSLVCLQIVLLFEEKTFRTWWDLVALNLFVVFLAAGLHREIWFGLLLGLYLFLALAAFSLLFLLREWIEHGDEERGIAARAPARPAIGRPANRGRVAKVALATLLVGPASLFLRYRETSPRGDAGAAIMRTAGRRREAPAARWNRAATECGVGGEYWRRIARLTFAAGVGGMLLFLVVPRFGGIDLAPLSQYALWTAREDRTRKAVGLSDTVQLSGMGTTINGEDPVLRIKFFDYRTSRPCLLQGDLYLRGMTLEWYNDGRWEEGLRRAAVPLRRIAAPNKGAAGRRAGNNAPADHVVRQQLTFQSFRRKDLFCVWPVVLVQDDPRLRYDPMRECLVRTGPAANRSLPFELGTTAFENGSQAELVPSESPVDVRGLLSWPSDALPGLAAKAGEWVAESGVSGGDSAGRARLLESRFRDSGLFEYTREGQAHEPGTDPIEEFITRNHRGDCQYFATALAMMLRSQGIPSRVIVGYKCSERDEVDECYQVYESDAHAWVEAFLDPQSLPAAQSRVPPGGRLVPWRLVAPGTRRPPASPARGVAPWRAACGSGSIPSTPSGTNTLSVLTVPANGQWCTAR